MLVSQGTIRPADSSWADCALGQACTGHGRSDLGPPMPPGGFDSRRDRQRSVRHSNCLYRPVVWSLSSTFPGSEFMVKHLLLVAFLICGAATAFAQPQQATSPPAPGTTTILPGRDMPAPTVSGDTRKLIGRNVQNAQNDTIGEIRSVYIDPDGKLDSLIVGVGGILGVGGREVRLA
ncbi:MAG: hypothetical protein GEV13_27260 [Rhodospirillales bacterium]|nr:hypothetical protein [Rhodospirillales bacterium]